MITTFNSRQWNESYTASLQQHATDRLESNHILFFPELPFSLFADEAQFLSANCADPKTKNISYMADSRRLWGVKALTDRQHVQLKLMLDRFSRSAYALVQNVLPSYTKSLVMGRTSFRPVQVCGRQLSSRKDDTRLHVDAFPSAPNQGKRILRVFTNVNPFKEDRIWQVGSSFEEVAKHFLPKLAKPLKGKSALLRMLKITKSYRTKYDHFMLQLHNKMKLDDHYQQTVIKNEIRFPPNTSWIVTTDSVPHAALEGRFVLEQTFYVPVEAMADASKSPLRILEKQLNCTLV